MNANKNDDKRYELNEQIKSIEMQQDDLVQARKNYERSLGDFQHNFRQLLYQETKVLEKSINIGSKRAITELEAEQETMSKVDAYVISELEESEDMIR